MQNEKMIEFDKIKEMWKEFALTNAAKEKIEETEIIKDETGLKRALLETTEAKEMLEKGGLPPLVSGNGLAELLCKPEKGDCMLPEELEQVGQFLVAVKRLREYLERMQSYDVSLAYYAENLTFLPELIEEIHRCIRSGMVDDYASGRLQDIRQSIARNEEQMRAKADSLLRSNKKYLADDFCTMRNGHLCIPVKKEYKLKIAGSVIDKSATGSTLFMEPTAIAEYAEQLQWLKIDEENEERRILYTLTNMVGDCENEIRENIRMMEKLDFAFSKAKLSAELGCCRPQINTERRIRIVNGRHPLMDKSSAVPLDFHIGDGINGIVITGPNTGGKTVSIKTVALLCMMAQCGLHIPAKEGDICMNSNYLCDIGDGQNLSENLSTFSAHILNVLDILKEVNPESLVIMDELGSGTDPAEGMGIAVAILEQLRKSGCLFLVTTHYPEVKQYAKEAEGIINARMTFDVETLKPQYKMVIGEAGESCAFQIARRLGMPEEMLEVAGMAAYGSKMQADCKEEKGAGCDEKTFGEIIAHTDAAYDKKPVKSNIQKQKKKKITNLSDKFSIGDSVMVLPDKKIGIVCKPVNEKGVLQVQLPNKKIWINHKRVKLHVKASELYPEDYDFSIIFDSVENRKLRHDMERKYVEGAEIVLEEE